MKKTFLSIILMYQHGLLSAEHPMRSLSLSSSQQNISSNIPNDDLLDQQQAMSPHNSNRSSIPGGEWNYTKTIEQILTPGATLEEVDKRTFQAGQASNHVVFSVAHKHRNNVCIQSEHKVVIPNSSHNDDIITLPSSPPRSPASIRQQQIITPNRLERPIIHQSRLNRITRSPEWRCCGIATAIILIAANFITSLWLLKIHYSTH